jgi:2',3'-cyclic-nucleotide 2'-phosphodiesterase (5'-nucleotidase family)
MKSSKFFYFLRVVVHCLTFVSAHLRIIHMNDCYTLENIPSLATAIKTLGKDYPTVFVHSGDFVSPPPKEIMDYGKTMIKILNSLWDVGIMTLGNHEFDISDQELRLRMEESKYQWISSNLNSFPDSEKSSTSSNHCLSQSMILEINNVSKLAFIGLVTDDRTIYSEDPSSFISNPVSTAEKLSKKFRNEPYNLDTIAITHLVKDMDIELAKSGDFLAILGGHEHEVFVNTFNNTPLVKCGVDANTFCQIDIIWNSETKQPEVKYIVHYASEYIADIEVQKLIDQTFEEIRSSSNAVSLLPPLLFLLSYHSFFTLFLCCVSCVDFQVI